ncbi:MAG: hypothetical protein QFX32_03055 [Methanolinea sp.]|nr:hypothetical protein [Methanolinea sp.]
MGGGRYGVKAARFLEAEGTQYILVDVDPRCPAATLVTSRGNFAHFICGGLDEAYDAFVECKPRRIFPAAPVHVAAGMVSAALGFRESAPALFPVLSHVPPGLVVGTKRGSLFLSRNRSGRCLADCPEPDACPVTRDSRQIPVHALLREILPGAHILESRQVTPGLGAIMGEDLDRLLAEVGDRDRVVIGTACRCHGVVTALERPGREWSCSEMRLDSVEHP